MKNHLENNMNDSVNSDLNLYTITSEFGLSHYNDHLKFRDCIDDDQSILKITPSVDDYKEYKTLRDIVSSYDGVSNNRKYVNEKIAIYESAYDWRDQLLVDEFSGKVGLISANGEKSLPPIFDEIRELPNTLFERQQYVPVKYRGYWGVVSTGASNVCALPFKFNNIIMERWQHQLIFVQNCDEKWGVYRIVNQIHDDSFEPPIVFPLIEPFVPCEYDCISEGKLQATSFSVPYWVLHKGEKFGILTPHGYTPAIFDAVRTNHNDAGFYFIQGDTFRKLNYYDIGIILTK